MKQVWYRYELWEDWQNGMYATSDKNKNIRIENSIDFFKNLKELYECMKYVAYNWKHSAMTNLTNLATNHQAWLGQASNCYKNKCNVDETIEVWHSLTEKQREEANKVADKVFYEWKRDYEKETEDYQISIFEEMEEK